jgi:hypothetical protein
MRPGTAVSDAELSALIATHYEAVGGDVHKDCDCHWFISERWSYGRRLGWVVEHDGYCYDALEDGEDGVFFNRQEAVNVMADHLRQAIAAIRIREGG